MICCIALLFKACCYKKAGEKVWTQLHPYAHSLSDSGYECLLPPFHYKYTQLVHQLPGCLHFPPSNLTTTLLLKNYFVGHEFQAVFVSTTEPIDHEGNTTNPTKSMCDPFIFNTLLTRSKSLVVVVGSPMMLLGIGEHMEKVYGQRAHCWRMYIRQCLENNTFVVPVAVEPDQEKRKIFHDKLVKMTHSKIPVPPEQAPSQSKRRATPKITTPEKAQVASPAASRDNKASQNSSTNNSSSSSNPVPPSTNSKVHFSPQRPTKKPVGATKKPVGATKKPVGARSGEHGMCFVVMVYELFLTTGRSTNPFAVLSAEEFPVS